MTPVLSRRTFLGAAMMAGLLAGCSRTTGADPQPSASSSTSADELIVGLTYVPDIQFAPLYVAQAQGWFADEGLNVTLRHHGAQERLLGALQTGDEHVVYAGGGEMMQGRSQGIDVVNFATMYQQYPVAIIVAESSPITTLEDVSGKKVGLPGEYGENWFYLLACMDHAGLARTDLNIESIGYTQIAALTGNQVDAVVGYTNNDLIRFDEAGFATRTITLDNPPLVSVGFGCLDQTLQNRSDELAHLLTAVHKGAEFCADQPEETVEIAADYITTMTDDEQRQHALATLKATMPLYLGDFGAQDADRWDAMAEFMNNHQLTETKVDPSDVFTTIAKA